MKVGAVNEPQSPRAAAQYIATITRELAQIAHRHRIDGLAYILDMAHMEAEQVSKGSSGAADRSLKSINPDIDKSWR